jgi:hypothetical protein
MKWEGSWLNTEERSVRERKREEEKTKIKK